MWISAALLKKAIWDGERLRVGDAAFEALYLDCTWLDREALPVILELARAGLPVILPRRPSRPGTGDATGFEAGLDQLQGLPNVVSSLTEAGLTPLVEGSDLPDFWARQDGDDLIIFFAHPGTRQVRVPDGARPGRQALRRSTHNHDSCPGTVTPGRPLILTQPVRPAESDSSRPFVPLTSDKARGA